MKTLHQYKHWRKSLNPLKEGTIILLLNGYNASTITDSLKEKTYLKIMKVRPPLFGLNECNADLVYDLVLCSKKGKEFKRKVGFSVEFIASLLEKNEIIIVS